MTDKTYHQRIKEEKRQAAVRAAGEIFLEQGYERTSLQQIATLAGVSSATLFKRYPTKAALFAATVEAFWSVDAVYRDTIPAGDPRNGLRIIGLDYVERIRFHGTVPYYRLIIAEVPRFPELGTMLVEKGIEPYLEWLNSYLMSEVTAGQLFLPDIPRTARAFLAMIAGQVFWPELIVTGSGGSSAEAELVVDEAVEMLVARYSAPVEATSAI